MNTAIPKVHYADTSSGQVAYMVFGEGPLEILCCEGAGFHLELAWNLPIGTQSPVYSRIALGREHACKLFGSSLDMVK